MKCSNSILQNCAAQFPLLEGLKRNLIQRGSVLIPTAHPTHLCKMYRYSACATRSYLRETDHVSYGTSLSSPFSHAVKVNNHWKAICTQYAGAVLLYALSSIQPFYSNKRGQTAGWYCFNCMLCHSNLHLGHHSVL